MPGDEATTDLRDGDLFAAVARGRAHESREAQRTLYARHVRYLYGALRRQEHKLLKLAGLSVEDLVQDTFQRAFERAASFAGEPSLDADRDRRRTRAWLGRIAQNLITDAFRRFREVSSSHALELATAPPDEAPPSSRPDLRALRAALETLSDREQDILRVSALYFKAKGVGRLPNAVAAELGARWGITSDNLRAIRKRALAKLRDAMQAEREETTG